jgi:hypothetical protein
MNEDDLKRIIKEAVYEALHDVEWDLRSDGGIDKKEWLRMQWDLAKQEMENRERHRRSRP